MDKVMVRTRALSQALFSLAATGCDTVEVSVVGHAVKLGGVRWGEDEVVTLHVWSKEAEDTEAQVGKGEALTEEECEMLDTGKCPKCPDHGQLYKGPKEGEALTTEAQVGSGLAILVSCNAGHTFWIPPLPLLPECYGQHTEAQEELEEEIESEGTYVDGLLRGPMDSSERTY